MATAKKSAAKKLTKKTAAKKVPAITDYTQDAAPEGKAAAEAAPKRRGRPPGSASKKSKAKKSPGRPPATRFLYSLSKTADDDGLGLDENTLRKVDVIGPFDSEEAAINDALATIGTEAGVEVTLYRDYRKGTPEIRARLI